MTLYVDASALLKLYIAEPDSDRARQILSEDPRWISGVHTLVEVRRNLHRELSARGANARAQFDRLWRRFETIVLDEATCAVGAELAELTGVRTLDALHLAAAQRAGGAALTFLTFDQGQAQAARSLGWTVVGA